ncbi:MAG: RNA polymerase sigma factor [Cytophagales bacterium]|nr:MAG: RNA polymerase sigma factor [Cytophagales bacterium]TAF59692.1 MAG: RNA polymerase sigma factor [Cytophagales bacterium]
MRFFSKTETEQDLIEGCKKGKASAQRKIYEQYSKKMFGICLRYIGNAFEAEDVLVMSFTRVFEHIHSYKNEGSFEGWIRRIVVNEALGLLRKKGRVSFDEIEVADYQGHFEVQTDDLQAAELMQLIKKLPDGYRTVFSMYAIEGYSHQEIADKLGITESTSKSQLNRARAQLKQAIESLQGEHYTYSKTAKTNP